eukprot:m.3257 g.3257  ORF g.3257 m.3257 type:complete len:687 (+) comp2721_c0_seq1:214-2274(+)
MEKPKEQQDMDTFVTNPKHVQPGATRNVSISNSTSSALLVIDVQEYCSIPQKGTHSNSKRDDNQYFFDRVDNIMVPNIAKLLTAARENAAEVIYTYIEALTEDGRDCSLDYKLSGPLLVPKGSPDARILDAIKPLPNDILIPKTSCSVFQSTNINYVLRNLGVRYLVIVGQLTNQCVESAVRDAADLGYLVTVVEDACAAENIECHTRGLDNMKGFARISTTDMICKEWGKGAITTQPIINTTQTTSKENDQIQAVSKQDIITKYALLKALLVNLKFSGVKYLRYVTCDNSAQIRCKALKLGTNSSSQLQNGAAFVEAMMALPLPHDAVAEDSGLSAQGMLNLVPDFSSLVHIPYAKGHAAVYGFLCKKNVVSPLCPRGFLKRMIDAVSSEGVTVRAGVEIEFTLLKNNSTFEPIDNTNWASVTGIDRISTFIDKLEITLEEQNISVLQVHAESAPGQFELVLQHTDDLIHLADSILTARQSIRAIATDFDMRVTFAPKPFPTSAGNGQHVHMSCNNRQSQFMAGVLKHLRGINAITTPSVSSFARTKPGCWAGAFAVWSSEHKEAAIRLCDGGEHFEVKTVDNTSNPYLALGCLLAAGFQGLKNNLDLPLPVDDIPSSINSETDALKPLPTYLSEALDTLECEKEIIECLGDQLTKAFVAVKRAELKYFVDKGETKELEIITDRL